MDVSFFGRSLIKRNEGLRLAAYQDVGGVWTIGYGDTGPDVVPGLSITLAEAERRFSDRLGREFGAAVTKAIGDAPTTQEQFDAMVSLAYNIGVGGFRKSRVLKYHLKQSYIVAGDYFRLWNRVKGHVNKGLVRRREEERALYLSKGA